MSSGSVTGLLYGELTVSLCEENYDHSRMLSGQFTSVVIVGWSVVYGQ